MSVYAREEEPLLDLVEDEAEAEDYAAGYCGLGVCCAMEGHEGTCAEASGWDEPAPVVRFRFQGAIDQLTVAMNRITVATASYNRVWTNWVQTPTWTSTGTYRTNTGTGGSLAYSWHNATGYTVMTPSYEDLWAKWGVRDQPIPQVGEFARQEAARRRQEENDRRQAEREAASRRRLAAQRLTATAKERAEELLDLILSPAEKIYRDSNNGMILVTGGETGRLYLVDTQYWGVHGNIIESDEHGCHLARLCVAPDMGHRDEHGDYYGMPLADGFVGQILSLKHNEPELLTKANFSHRRQCAHQDVPVLQRAS